MGLFEKLTNAVKKAPSGLYDTLMQEEAFIDNERRKAMANNAVVPMQIAEDGSIDKAKTLALKNAIKPLTFADRLLGRTLTEDTQVTNPGTGETTMETVSNYRPGLLTDFSAGMNENYRENFAPENFANSDSALGNKKGLAYRLGEGAGSLAKILAGVGGDAFTAGYNGLKEAQQRQSMRVSDKLYRDALSSRGINTEGLGGLVDSNTFNALLQDAQLKDNAAYRKMYYDMQAQNQKDMMDYRRMQSARQEKQDAIDTGLKLQELNLKRQKLEDDRNKKSGGLDNLTAVSNQLKRFEDTFKTMPNKLESNTLGRFRNVTGLQTKEEVNFNSQRTLLFNKIARDLGGEKGVLSDQDIKRVEKSLPAYTDSYEQKQAKMAAIYDLLNDRLAVEGGNMQTSGDNDPLGIL